MDFLCIRSGTVGNPLRSIFSCGSTLHFQFRRKCISGIVYWGGISQPWWVSHDHWKIECPWTPGKTSLCRLHRGRGLIARQRVFLALPHFATNVSGRIVIMFFFRGSPQTSPLVETVEEETTQSYRAN